MAVELRVRSDAAPGDEIAWINSNPSSEEVTLRIKQPKAPFAVCSPASISNLFGAIHREGGPSPWEHTDIQSHTHMLTAPSLFDEKEQLRKKWGRIIRGNGWWRLYWLEQLQWSSSHCSNYHWLQWKVKVGGWRCSGPAMDHDAKRQESRKFLWLVLNSTLFYPLSGKQSYFVAM